MMTHICTSCGNILVYNNKGSWKNAKGTLKKNGVLRCAPCAAKESQKTRKTKPTGRPKGVKNKDNTKNAESSRKRIIEFNKFRITKEQREKGIANRHGFDSYQQYQESLPAWKKYRNIVDKLTKNQPLYALEHYEKRGVNGKEGAYTLDHIISVVKGFKNNIDPEAISHISNLKMIPWKDNIQKGWK